MFHSVGGGTGSGLNSLIAENLSVEYGKKTKFGYCLYPSPKVSCSALEPFNAVLSTHGMLEHNDVTIISDNESLYN